MDRHVTFRIVLKAPPAGVLFGLQKGRGPGYETIQAQRSTNGDLSFELSAVARPAKRDAGPDFRGPCVQGPAGGRFVYVDIGASAGQADTPWSRRLKVPLTGITWDQIERVTRDADAILETRVPGTGRDGTPACATVKPFPGWTVARRG